MPEFLLPFPLLIVAYRLLLGLSRHTNKIDAISVARLVRQIVSKVCSGVRDAFSILQTSHVIPHDFFVAKAGPTMTGTFGQEFLHTASLGSFKQQVARDGIVKLDGEILWLQVLQRLQKFRGLPVSSVFRIVAVCKEKKECCESTGAFTRRDILNKSVSDTY